MTRPSDTERPMLLRFRISHYCRKVEWALRRAGIPYDVTDLSLPQMVDLRDLNPENTVPVLIVDGRRICGSAAIMRWIDAGSGDLYPTTEVVDWEAWADEEIGPRTRRMAYRALYEAPHRYGRNPAVWLAARALRPVILQILKSYQARRYYAEDEAAWPGILERVARQAGEGFLFGDRATAADLSTAALLAPALAIRLPWARHADVPALRRYVERVRVSGKPVKRRRLGADARKAWAALPISPAR